MSDPLGGPVLAIDASTYGGTVAVVRGAEVIAAREVAMRGEREERLMPAVVDVLADAGVAVSALTAVVCGTGPGSFTSLRIAASIAKGIAHAASIPLYAMPSLALLVAGNGRPDGRYLAALDAIRGDWYVAEIMLVDRAVARYEYLGIVPAAQGPTLATERDARLVVTDGMAVDGMEDRDVTRSAPRARGVVALAGLLASAGPVDLDGWEPDYGRKAEAQVKWEAVHGRELPVSGGTPG